VKSLEITHGSVAELTLVGPGRGNAMGPDFWRELPEAMASLDADPEVRAVVIAGRGRSFSYGLDLMGMAGTLMPLLQGKQKAVGRRRLLTFIRRLQAAIDAVANARMPVVAALHGWCIGGGLDLASACDVRLASADARISLREAKVAIVADLGSLQRLPRIIGEGHTRELAYTGGDVNARDAERMGLVNRVYADKEALLVGARALGAAIAENPPVVVEGIKEVMNHGANVQAGLDHVAVWNAAFLQSDALDEALSAFLQGRKPKF